MSTVIVPPSADTHLRTDPAHTHADAPVQPARRRYPEFKAVVDFILALLLMILAAPVILLSALLIKLTSRGPALYTQLRVGRGGRVFWIYKLRTMTHNCESQSGACWAKPADPRITLIGRFLRKTHLDELPQLWNVLRGDMALVGPRPERPEFVPGLEQQIPSYRDRLAVRPGLTGLAQVQLPADTDIDSVRRKLLYDRYYIDNMSFWLDFRLILSTGFKVLHIPFAVARTLLRIPSARLIEKAPAGAPLPVQSPHAPCLQAEVA